MHGGYSMKGVLVELKKGTIFSPALKYWPNRAYNV